MTSLSAPARVNEKEARRMYRRVIAGWARDALLLRKTGHDRPGSGWKSSRRRAA